MNADDFSKIASGIQSIITTIGIVIGGIWVLYTFWDLGSAEKAKLDIANAEQELANQQQEPVLSISLKWGKPTEASKGKYSEPLTVFVKNDGKMALDFKDTFLLISRLLDTSGEIDPDIPLTRLGSKALCVNTDTQGTKECTDGKFSPMPDRVLRGGQGRNISFFIPELVTGYYLAQFQTTYFGLLVTNGIFRVASGQGINAIDQAVIKIPDGLESAASGVGKASAGTKK